MRTMHAVEDALPLKIKDLDDALEILNTPDWTLNDFECDSTLQGDDRYHSRLDVCTVQLARIVLKPDTGRSFEGYFTQPGNELQESAFWVCVSEAQREAVLCLRNHQQNHKKYEPLGLPELEKDIVMRNAGQYVHLKTPGARNQVHVAYSLVTLLYATFNIDVPAPQKTPVWGALPVYAYQRKTEFKPAFQCLGTSEDKYGLRQYLRSGNFRIEDVHFDYGHPFHRIQWSPTRRMPWRDILAELVGYIRFAEALVPDTDKPPTSVLQEMRDYCTAEKGRLQHDLDMNLLSSQVATFDIAEEFLSRRPHPPAPDSAPADSRLTRLLTRMHTLINT
jgi:hypothetical protein